MLWEAPFYLWTWEYCKSPSFYQYFQRTKPFLIFHLCRDQSTLTQGRGRWGSEVSPRMGWSGTLTAPCPPCSEVTRWLVIITRIIKLLWHKKVDSDMSSQPDPRLQVLTNHRPPFVTLTNKLISAQGRLVYHRGHRSETATPSMTSSPSTESIPPPPPPQHKHPGRSMSSLTHKEPLSEKKVSDDYNDLVRMMPGQEDCGVCGEREQPGDKNNNEQ